MKIEIQMLAWSMALGLVQLLLAVGFVLIKRGIPWAMGPRDEPVAELQGVAGRLERAWRNFVETFPFFAAAVLALESFNRADPSSALGAQLYFWARVVYVPVYAAGIPYLRSVVWGASLAGIALIASRLF